MAFSAVPTPLYVLYQARDGFGPFTLTVIFAAYAAGVALSLLETARLNVSGRRFLLLPTSANRPFCSLSCQWALILLSVVCSLSCQWGAFAR